MSNPYHQYPAVIVKCLQEEFPDVEIRETKFNPEGGRMLPVTDPGSDYVSGCEINGKSILIKTPLILLERKDTTSPSSRLSETNGIDNINELSGKAEYDFLFEIRDPEKHLRRIGYNRRNFRETNPARVKDVLIKIIDEGKSVAVNDSLDNKSNFPGILFRDPARLEEQKRRLQEEHKYYTLNADGKATRSASRMIESYDDLLLTISKICEIAPKPFGYTGRNLLNLFSEGQVKQIVLTGAPGTGKTFTATSAIQEMIRKQLHLPEVGLPQTVRKRMQQYYEFVQFHPSYDYSDFVEGLRPALLRGKDETSFVRLDGSFKAFCRRIVENTEKDRETDMKYYFIIDEINRADLSQVFGELMYGLEESYRGAEHSFSTRLQNLPVFRIAEDGKAEPIKNDVFKDGFYIPDNLYIIGTMNEIDRSVEAFDFALRRRFQWIEVKAEDELSFASPSGWLSWNQRKSLLGGAADLIERINHMNEIISGEAKATDSGQRIGLGSSYQIGHTYFRDYDGNDDTLNDIWAQRIEPLLREYCRGRNPDLTEAFITDCRSALMNP